jgi:hypothetical protein
LDRLPRRISSERANYTDVFFCVKTFKNFFKNPIKTPAVTSQPFDSFAFFSAASATKDANYTALTNHVNSFP